LVIAVEVDPNLVFHLKKTMPSNVKIIEGDVLEMDLNELPSFNKIVSNLPFHISSSITFKLLEYNFDKAILMYQREFAERMIAKTGDENYSRLSVMIACKAQCRILEYISKRYFTPMPKVDACIVELIPYKMPPFHIEDEFFFSNIVREFFNHRRKKIRYTIKTLFGKIDQDVPFQDRRIEELTPREIVELSNLLYNRYSKSS
ncbi:MAG TPA: ribosomal RNA small subunit methyltransferase A, partial [Thermoplasmatales archaeon]|nr:ribosomal RNA small subunit methyltransferase A [Thermoplasmatales archaeon]